MGEKNIKNKKELKKKLKNKQQGITLIALIVTIIVLLILASVSIAMLTGNNGILTQAQRAKTETENAATNEAGILDDYEEKINEALGVKEQAEPGKYYEEDTEVELGGKELTIPGGASISKIPGEYESIDNGLVIYITNKQITDEEWQDIEIMQTTYDQFVWIPVTENYDRNITYEVVEVSTSAYTDIDYLPEGIQPTIPEKITEPENIGKINEEAERQAVRLKGGFYISRYEAGKDINDNLISRKGAEVWLNKKQKEFKDLGKTFEIKNNTKVKSAMCSGIQWDMIMKFITENDEDYDVLNGNQNWHMGSSVSLTGENDEDEGCNIYDLESNAYEYVAEKSSYYNSYGTYPFVIRGGLYEVNSPASVRLYSNDVADDYTSFRFVIYII